MHKSLVTVKIHVKPFSGIRGSQPVFWRSSFLLKNMREGPEKASDTFPFPPWPLPHPGRWEHFHSPLWFFSFSSFQIQGRSAHLKAQFIPQHKLKEDLPPFRVLFFSSFFFLQEWVFWGGGFYERKTNLSSSAWLWRHSLGVESWDFSKSWISFTYACWGAELRGCEKWCAAWSEWFGRGIQWWIWLCQSW